MALADQRKGRACCRRGLARPSYKAIAIHCDVADDSQVEAMVEQTVAAFGRLWTRPTTTRAFRTSSPKQPMRPQA